MHSLQQAADQILNGSQAWLGYAMAEAMAVQQAANIKLQIAMLGFPENITAELERIVRNEPPPPPRAIAGGV
ncbi:hypothetical protein [Aquimonas voraii]|uniref:hypothetical protein n=1 Tax=Aquimonas voraii TaxID=265719 RepID=UPI000B85E7B1|nr:hypothetical protein [Aquimonas voraii]